MVSIITTIYRAEAMLDELVLKISEACESFTNDFEIILVEDCGPDNSWKKIEEISKINKRVKGIKLSRNFGQQMAMSAGLRFASGNIVVIMDGDLQNPPEAIPIIVEKVKEGNDIVYTVSKTRNDFMSAKSSEFFWFVINKIFHVNVVPNQLMLKGFSKRFVETYNRYDERIRVVSGITHDIGLNHTVIEIENRKRKHGKSNYNSFQRFHLMIDIILAMTNAPLNYIINISLMALVVTIFAGIWNLITYFFLSNVPAGYTTIVLLILFFGSLTLLILGIIGRYLSNIYVEVRNRPAFIVNKKTNFDE